MQFLNWKFGRSLEEEDLKLGYCMHFLPGVDMTNLEWRYEGKKRGDSFASSPSLSLLSP